MSTTLAATLLAWLSRLSSTNAAKPVRDAAEMAEAIGRVGALLDPEGIRRVARERFSDARMAGGYLALYRRLAA